VVQRELLHRALELVTGAPFEGVPPRTYNWAYDHQIVSAIEVAVVDAAHRLAELATEEGDVAEALWATRQGHLATPDHEGLYRDAMRAHARDGDVDGINQAYREAQRAAQSLDPLDEVQPETATLYRDLLRDQEVAARASS